jgi:hypothetical protein
VVLVVVNQLLDLDIQAVAEELADLEKTNLQQLLTQLVLLKALEQYQLQQQVFQ